MRGETLISPGEPENCGNGSGNGGGGGGGVSEVMVVR